MSDFRLETSDPSNILAYQIESGMADVSKMLERSGDLANGSWALVGPVSLYRDAAGKLTDVPAVAGPVVPETGRPANIENTSTGTFGYTLRLNGDNPFRSGDFPLPDPAKITVYAPGPDQPVFAAIA